jgi:hypothetical protein
MLAVLFLQSDNLILKFTENAKNWAGDVAQWYSTCLSCWNPAVQTQTNKQASKGKEKNFGA